MQNTVEVLNEISSELKRSRARYTPPSKDVPEEIASVRQHHSPLRMSYGATRSPPRYSASPIKFEEMTTKSDDHARELIDRIREERERFSRECDEIKMRITNILTSN